MGCWGYNEGINEQPLAKDSDGYEPRPTRKQQLRAALFSFLLLVAIVVIVVVFAR